MATPKSRFPQVQYLARLDPGSSRLLAFWKEEAKNFPVFAYVKRLGDSPDQ
jgi:hypothetical protein